MKLFGKNSICAIAKVASLFFILIIFFTTTSKAQKSIIKGKVVDTTQKNAALENAIVALINENDSVLYTSIRTSKDGAFLFINLLQGNYKVQVMYPNMADNIFNIMVFDSSKIDIGNIIMVNKRIIMEEVVVRSGYKIRMKGDTLEYNADSFAVKSGANVEALLKRLPGVQVKRDGTIITQGKKVQQVLVDGDEFFSEDPGLVTKFLNAEIIDKVQVYDAKSEEELLTGVQTTEGVKTINLKLKKNKSSGVLAKLTGSISEKKFYDNSIMAAKFNKKQKFSVYILHNKISNRVFSDRGLSNYVESDYENINDGTNEAYGINYNEGNVFGPLPQQFTVGTHFSQKWNKNQNKFFGNYLYKTAVADNWNKSKNLQFTSDTTNFSSKSTSSQTSSANSTKGEGSIKMQVDSFSTISLFIGKAYAKSFNSSQSTNSSSNEKNNLVNMGISTRSENNTSKKINSSLRYTRQFKKSGTFIDIKLFYENTDVNEIENNYNANEFFNPNSGINIKKDTLQQLQNSLQQKLDVGARILFGRKINKKLTIGAEYGYKTSVFENDLNVFDQNQNRNTKIDSLSMKYKMQPKTNFFGGSFAFNNKKWNVSLSNKIFFTNLLQATSSTNNSLLRKFINFTPRCGLTYRINKTQSINGSYFGYTYQPTTEQLQPVLRNSNPLFVILGNSKLLPSFSQGGSIAFSNYNYIKNREFSFGFNINNTNNAIILKTNTDSLNKSTSQYENINNQPSYGANLNYGVKIKKLNLRTNFSIDPSIGNYKNYFNKQLINNTSHSLRSNFTLEYEKEDKFDAKYSFSADFTKTNSSLNKDVSAFTNTFSHTIELFYSISKKIEVTTNCTMAIQGVNQTFDTKVYTTFWSANLEHKLFKNERGLLKLTVQDILNNNNGIQRYAFGTNIYEGENFVINRFYLLSFSWNFSKSL